jgi:hypothetical protein
MCMVESYTLSKSRSVTLQDKEDCVFKEYTTGLNNEDNYSPNQLHIGKLCQYLIVFISLWYSISYFQYHNWKAYSLTKNMVINYANSWTFTFNN